MDDHEALESQAAGEGDEQDQVSLQVLDWDDEPSNHDHVD